MIAQAQSGTGKTSMIALALCQNLETSKNQLRTAAPAVSVSVPATQQRFFPHSPYVFSPVVAADISFSGRFSADYSPFFAYAAAAVSSA